MIKGHLSGWYERQLCAGRGVSSNATSCPQPAAWWRWRSSKRSNAIVCDPPLCFVRRMIKGHLSGWYERQLCVCISTAHGQHHSPARDRAIKMFKPLNLRYFTGLYCPAQIPARDKALAAGKKFGFSLGSVLNFLSARSPQWQGAGAKLNPKFQTRQTEPKPWTES